MRKNHSKSKLGCKECKSLRVKCDERRPACGRCSRVGRSCSYTRDAPVLPVPTSPQSRKHAEPAESRFLPPLPTTQSAGPGGAFANYSAGGECFGMLHLRLLRHFEHDLGEHMMTSHPNIEDLLSLFITEGLKTPYLMDEVLAYAAAHKSTTDPETSPMYAREATRLQTRALASYNCGDLEVTEETSLPMFLLSSLLGHHLLFDLLTVSRCEDLTAVLDTLVQCITVNRGLSAIAQSSWQFFDESTQEIFVGSCLRDNVPKGDPSLGECAGLVKLLEASDLSSSSIAIHRNAVDLLQHLLDHEHSSKTVRRGNLDAIQDWLIGISAEFIQCLYQRRPEALAILAHYAGLVHRANKYWFIDDLGKRLIRLINNHLGPSWADWLDWPNRTVGYQAMSTLGNNLGHVRPIKLPALDDK